MLDTKVPFVVNMLPFNPKKAAILLEKRPAADRPVKKLSVSLLDTYHRVNKVYCDQKDANDVTKLSYNDILNDRYILRQTVGKGSFGRVYQATDRQTKQHVAIKVFPKKFKSYCQSELQLLKWLNEKDAYDEHNIGKCLFRVVFFLG